MYKGHAYLNNATVLGIYGPYWTGASDIKAIREYFRHCVENVVGDGPTRWVSPSSTLPSTKPLVLSGGRQDFSTTSWAQLLVDEASGARGGPVGWIDVRWGEEFRGRNSGEFRGQAGNRY